MRAKLISGHTEKINPIQIDPINFLDSELTGLQNSSQVDLIQALLYEIIRVKELIKHYEAIANNEGQFSASILNELVSEAYSSLVDYDIALMNKYYDLLKNCD
jgi:hypothetical protein